MKIFHPVIATTALLITACSSMSDREVKGITNWPTIADDIEATGFSGTAAIVQEGEVIESVSFGFEDREDGRLNTQGTRYSLASVGKLLTAVAVMQLVDEGMLNLDETVGSVLPDYENAVIRDKVTILHLVKMRSGMGDIFDIDLSDLDMDPQTHADWVELFEMRPPAFEPGTEFGYSNSSYMLLGRIVEVVSGQDFYSYMRENMFAPLGMKDTDYNKIGVSTPGVAIPYTFGSYETDLSSIVNLENPIEASTVKGTAAGGGYSTIGDFARLDHALRTGELISMDSLSVIFSREFVEGGDRGAGLAGGAPGVSTRYRMLPNRDTAKGTSIIVFGNADQPNAPDIARFIETEISQ